MKDNLFSKIVSAFLFLLSATLISVIAYVIFVRGKPTFILKILGGLAHERGYYCV
jgi:hypothetical protein